MSFKFSPPSLPFRTRPNFLFPIVLLFITHNAYMCVHSYLGRASAVDRVRVVPSGHRQSRRHGRDLEVVDLAQLLGVAHGGARHAAQIRVAAEQRLVGHGGRGLRFG